MGEFDMNSEIPMLIPYLPAEFWAELRKIVREEIKGKQKCGNIQDIIQTPGLSEKPLYRIAEICKLFNVSRTTIHEWVKIGKLRKIKVNSRVYFLGTDIKKIIE
jgi:excisionase family DNA binding protein